ncbi:MAG: 1,4-dihydroxy-2-naphthoyl-CoA hydrolase [Myxococcota bacterium]|nr:1,4-dihydroxy-2-naphthoyl-CoA hydrolase [Myxococcota bacterium]
MIESFPTLPGGPINAEWRELLMQRAGDHNDGFTHTVGVKLDDVQWGWARSSLQFNPRVSQPANLMHGGAMMTLVDDATAWAILSMHGPGVRFVTMNLNMNFLRPVSRGAAIAEARVVRAGQRTVYLDCQITGSDGKLCAHSTVTYFILQPGSLWKGKEGQEQG